MTLVRFFSCCLLLAFLLSPTLWPQTGFCLSKTPSSRSEGKLSLHLGYEDALRPGRRGHAPGKILGSFKAEWAGLPWWRSG